MLSSIRIQLITVLIALIALILAQGYVARENQATLTTGVSSAAKTVVDVSLVKELERDVVDLQRNVLIFKENASKSAFTRFGRLMVSIDAKLDKLAENNNFNSRAEDGFVLNRMREHLTAYEENFVQVVDARAERDSLIANGTLSDIALIEDLFTVTSNNGLINTEFLDKARVLLLNAENAMLKYISKPDMNYISSFNQSIDALQTPMIRFLPNLTLSSSRLRCPSRTLPAFVLFLVSFPCPSLCLSFSQSWVWRQWEAPTLPTCLWQV